MTIDELIEKLQALKPTLDPSRENVVTIIYDNVCEVPARENIQIGVAWRCKGCEKVHSVQWCGCDYFEYNNFASFEELTAVTIETNQE